MLLLASTQTTRINGQSLLHKIRFIFNQEKKNVIMRCLHLTELLTSTWGCLNRLCRSYVTQGDRKIHDLLPLPPPPATVMERRPWRVPGFSRLNLSWAGIVSYWLERAAYSQSKWRRLISWRQWNWPERSYVTNNFWIFFTYSMFSYRKIYFIRNAWRQKNSLDANWEIHIVVT